MHKTSEDNTESPFDDVRATRRTAVAGTVRAGWITCGAGLLVTVFGAWRTAAGGDFPSAGARMIHFAGLLVMLVGFVVALIGYRIPWFRAVSKNIRSSSGGSDNMGSASQGSRSSERPSLWASFVLLLGVSGGVFVSIILIILVPDWLAGIYIILFTLAATVALVVTLVYGKNFQRTFCIGALVPIGSAVWNSLPFTSLAFSLVSLGAGFGRSSRSLDFRNLIRLLENYGEASRMSTSIIWVLAILAGLFAVFVRIGIQNLNAIGARDSTEAAPLGNTSENGAGPLRND